MSETNRVPLGPYAQARHYFDYEQDFPAECAEVVKRYEEASQNAIFYAQYHVKKGTNASFRKAQWHEAIAQTLEQCLSLLGMKDNLFDYPEAPGEPEMEFSQEPNPLRKRAS